MIALICFVLAAVPASSFKSKGRVCTENLKPTIMMMKSEGLRVNE
jgi:hypothetical protein